MAQGLFCAQGYHLGLGSCLFGAVGFISGLRFMAQGVERA